MFSGKANFHSFKMMVTTMDDFSKIEKIGEGKFTEVAHNSLIPFDFLFMKFFLVC